MSNIRTIIVEAADSRGVLSFERFMGLALYCPNFGYYERKDAQVGQSGDFFTSVSVGSFFGELLATQFAEWLEALGGGGQILEAGAHDGQLAADILGWLQAHRPRVFESLEYWLLEPSERHRETQESKLRSFADKVRWFKDWEALPSEGVRGLIFSNELLDAMPVKRLGWDAAGQKWFEWAVAVRDRDFTWTKMATDRRPGTAMWTPSAELLKVLPDGFTTEVGEVAANWWRAAARYLRKGKLLAFDYGLTQEEFFTPERKDGTLRAYYRHHLETDLLARPGEQDITGQVNFTAIRETGEAEGLETETFETQAGFLTGIVNAACERNPATAEWMARNSRAFQTLTHPEHLGRPFRVLVQAR